VHEYLNSTKLEQYFDLEVVSPRIAHGLTVEMVEVFSGRRRVQNGSRQIVDASRPTYELVVQALGLKISIGNSS